MRIKIIAFVLSITLALIFAACAENNNNIQNSSDVRTTASSVTSEKEEKANIPVKSFDGADFIAYGETDMLETFFYKEEPSKEVSSMEPNRIARDQSTYNFAAFEAEYYNIQKKRANELEIAVAPLNSVYRYVRTQKDDFSLVGGNNNHPNVFTVRLYAQTVLSVLGAYDMPIFLTEKLPDGKTGKDYLGEILYFCTTDTIFSARGLPFGLSISANGLITGKPEKSGEYVVTVRDSSSLGQSEKTFVLSVQGEVDSVGSSSKSTEKQTDNLKNAERNVWKNLAFSEFAIIVIMGLAVSIGIISRKVK